MMITAAAANCISFFNDSRNSGSNLTFFGGSPSRTRISTSSVKIRLAPIKVKVSNNNKTSSSSSSPSAEQKWVAKGLITESLPNGMFWVRLENGDVVLGYVSGKIRRNSIRMLPGDKVKIEVSRYDSTRGRIVYRIGNKDL
ncbi:translation initiation factor 1 [Tanacetum coccineum]